ncbi:hypothetical protein BKA56DRAFT_472334 [Ilyonectria sp. MPI-CAGE-AT-0026]|nr:hypothetical protein BKA56DRAFT_472334 [Ilyonectria sp. MPI-CAGE-AT-0026]
MDAVLRYSISNGSDAGADPSWADINDPKEKKKVQNRIAQRSYRASRQRMKARLEKLQAKVNYHEQMNLDNTPRDDDVQNRQAQQQEQQQQQQPHQLQGNPEPYHPVTLESLTPESPGKHSMQPQVLQSTFYDHAAEKGNKPIYMQPQLMDDTQQLPPNRAMSDPNAKACDKLPIDYMRLPKQQMADKLPATTLADHSPQDDGARMRGELPPHVGGGGSSSGLAMDSSLTDLSSVSPAPSAKQGLDERLEYVLSCTRAAGFESFDALVTAYYNGNFEDSSPLAIEQRLSRNRGLPSVVADVFRDARRWSDWERRGFDEELLKTTESMLVSEGEDSRSSLESVLSMLSAPQNGSGGGDGSGTSASQAQATLAMKKVMQNELPNLWALMMAFSAEHRDVWQRNRSNTVLAAILLLRYPGRIPNDQLLKLVSGCL